MAENSTTETGADQSSSGIDNEPLLDNQQSQSADEQQDTGSSDSQSQDSGQSDEGRQDDITQDSSSDDDDSLAKFARAQGFDPDNLTDGEKKALKLARDNQKAFRDERQRKSEETRKAVEEVHQSDDEDFDDDPVLAKIAAVEAKANLQEFYANNPEARDYDSTMGEILVEFAEQHGKPAARALAADMSNVLALAKARKGDTSADVARETGRREERELLRKRQEGSAQGANATDSHQSGTGKVTSDWVTNEYDPSNPKHREMLDKALADGDLY